jgi:hypothetical protein
MVFNYVPHVGRNTVDDEYMVEDGNVVLVPTQATREVWLDANTVECIAPACSLAEQRNLYTEATRGTEVDLTSQYDGVDILAVNYRYNDTQNSVKELNWVTDSCKVGIHTSNRYSEAYNAPACSLVYCDAANRAFGHAPEAVAEIRVVAGYSYYDGFIRRTGTVTTTRCVCNPDHIPLLNLSSR